MIVTASWHAWQEAIINGEVPPGAVNAAHWTRRC